MKYDIITIGGTLRDIIFYTDEGMVIENRKDSLCEKLIAFELGAKIYIKEVYFVNGGGACNTAVGLSRLGLKTAIIARIGRDKEGDELIKSLKKESIDTKFIQRDSREATGFSFIATLKKKNVHTILTYRGASDRVKLETDIKKLKSTKWFYVSSLNCPQWRQISDKIFSLSNYGVKIAWNPANVQLKVGAKNLIKYLKKTTVFILNEDEARELVATIKPLHNLTIQFLLQEINKMGPKIVVITIGKRGAYAFDGGKIYYQGPIPAKVINTTGAGDAFSAAFVASLFYKPNDIYRALKWGCTNSASVITKIGAQKGLLNKSQIKK